MSLLFSGKKGQLRNYMAVVLFIFAFGFICIFAYKILSEIITAFIATGFYTGQLAATGNRFLAGIALLDYLILFLAVILVIAVGVTTFKLAASPIFFVVTLIMGFFMGFVSYFFNYIFAQLVSDAAFTATLLVFPRTVFLCTNLHWLALITIAVGSITLYAKKERGQFLG